MVAGDDLETLKNTSKAWKFGKYDANCSYSSQKPMWRALREKQITRDTNLEQNFWRSQPAHFWACVR
jgi:hypothetical protein